MYTMNVGTGDNEFVGASSFTVTIGVGVDAINSINFATSVYGFPVGSVLVVSGDGRLSALSMSELSSALLTSFPTTIDGGSL